MPLTPDQRQFWNVIKYDYDINKELDGNRDLLEAIEISQRINRVIEPLAYYMYNLANRVIIKKGYKTLVYQEDMRQHTITLMMRSILHFDATKSDNPFAYMVTLAHSGCLNYIAKERKQKDIKDDLAERILYGQETN